MARKKRKRRHTRRGLHGTGHQGRAAIAHAASMNNVMDVGKKAAYTIAGMIVGNIASNSLEKMINKDGSDGIKKYIAPVATVAGGAIAAGMLKDDMKYLGVGIAAAGGIKVVKQAFNKDLLNGEDTIQGLLGLEDDGDLIPGIGAPAAMKELEEAVRSIQVSGSEGENIYGDDEPIQTYGPDDEVNGSDDFDEVQ
jgi:hypothetical protein